MSSLGYGNDVIPPTHEDSSSNIVMPLVAPGAIVPHPYLSSNPNTAYDAATMAAAAALSVSPSTTLGQYRTYYGHVPSGQPQPLLHMAQPGSFYSATPVNHLPQPGDFSNSSSSIASSSSSLELARKGTNRKRANEKNLTTVKSAPKRKNINHDDDDIDDDEDDEDNKPCLHSGSMSNAMMSNHSGMNSSSTGGAGEEDKEKQARENHCEIERRRRVKMATYFTELCDMVPSCSNLARKPDKLTILRMAAQFMKNLRTNNNSLIINPNSMTSASDLHKPSFLNDQELKYLMVESCDAFLFALNCETLRIIYVSDAIQHILSYTCQDWYSRLFYDLLHPDDVEKVREQLTLQNHDGSPTNGSMSRVLDLKTGTVKKDGHTSGARLTSSKRSFICRLRVGTNNVLETQPHGNPYLNPSILRRRHRTSLGPSVDGHIYEVVHISGYIRNLNTHHHSSSHLDSNAMNTASSSSNSNGQLAFIAIARIQNSCAPNLNDLTNGPLCNSNSLTTEFTCRCHWETGAILFIDQRCTPIIGYKCQDLLQKSIYEQIHPDDQMKFQDLFKRTVAQKNLVNTASNLTHILVRFRTTLDNEYISLKASTYAFCNPCTDDIEFLIVTFLSGQANSKTSIITNTNEYNRNSYETYSRANSTNNQAAHYTTESPSNYIHVNGQDFTSTNADQDGRTYASNNSGTAWAAANENWSASASETSSVVVNNADYVDAQSAMSIYHQYH